MENFDPNGVGINNGNYFGLPFDEQEARLVLLSVPWDVTASYGGGASFAPDAIIEASTQLDLYDPSAPGAWRAGIATIGIDYSIQDRSARYRADARRVMEHLENGGMMFEEYLLPRKVERINNASEELNEQVYREAKERLSAGKIVGLVGGDHSTPLGLIKAVAEREQSIGILHIDAHCDLRESYEGFTYSHASIMFNVLREVPGVETIVQVAVRDYCDREAELAASSPRVKMFDDHSICRKRFAGATWQSQCEEIVAALPEKVYVSFDIDGLSAEYCPSTGTPVAGGLSFNEAVWLIQTVVDSGRRIVGFDLCEVAPSKQQGEWDANVGARVLFRLCGQTLKSNGGIGK